MSGALQIRGVNVTDADWTPLRAALGCDYFSVWNSSGSIVWLRSDKDDETTEKQLAPGAQEIMLAPRSVAGAWALYRFSEDETIFFCRSAAGPVRLEVTFIR